jgi:hypothetical protein
MACDRQGRHWAMKFFVSDDAFRREKVFYEVDPPQESRHRTADFRHLAHALPLPQVRMHASLPWLFVHAVAQPHAPSRKCAIEHKLATAARMHHNTNRCTNVLPLYRCSSDPVSALHQVWSAHGPASAAGDSSACDCSASVSLGI